MPASQVGGGIDDDVRVKGPEQGLAWKNLVIKCSLWRASVSTSGGTQSPSSREKIPAEKSLLSLSSHPGACEVL